MAQRSCKQSSKEFKGEVVALVGQQGYPVPESRETIRRFGEHELSAPGFNEPNFILVLNQSF